MTVKIAEDQLHPGWWGVIEEDDADLTIRLHWFQGPGAEDHARALVDSLQRSEKTMPSKNAGQVTVSLKDTEVFHDIEREVGWMNEDKLKLYIYSLRHGVELDPIQRVDIADHLTALIKVRKIMTTLPYEKEQP